MNPLRVRLGLRTGTVICSLYYPDRWLILWDGGDVSWAKVSELELENSLKKRGPKWF